MKRINTLDYLRGVALMGIILVNVLPMLSVTIPKPDTVDAGYQRFLFLFVEGRFFTIFSFLFGVGFYLFITRANEKKKRGTLLFLRRILVLFIFGVIHFLFQPGEALSVYAICGLLVLPFYKMKKEINLIAGLAMLIIMSIFSIKLFMTFPLILLGLTAGQYQVFENLSQKKKKFALFTGIMFVLTAIALLYQYQQAPEGPFQLMVLEGVDDPIIEQTNTFIRIGIMVGPIVSAFYVGALTLLLQNEWIHKLLSPLKNYGRTALTNYISQTAFILMAGHLFDLFGKISHVQSLFLCLTVYVIQLIFSTIWLRFFQYGPLEWVWRMVTFLEVLPIRNKGKNLD